MYIIISIFAVYAAGIIAYELKIFSYFFVVVFVVLIYNSLTKKKFIYNRVILTFIMLSFLNCNYNAKPLLSQHINDNITVEVKIKRQYKKESNSYYASVISINNNPIIAEEAIIYADKNDTINENSIVRINCRVADNSITKNKMLFNYKNYLRSKKISTTLFASGQALVIKEDYSFLNSVSLKFRNYVENTFYNNLYKKNGDIILSVILGDVDYLDEEMYDNIKVMGLAHIFAVSGSHIVLMYVFLLNVFKFVASKRISWILSWFIIWFYGFLIGFPLSVMRALVMFTLLFGSEVLYRKYNSLNSIGLAALILTIYNPFWIFDAGFLLSFSAALSLIIYNKYIRVERTIFNTVYMYLFLQIFTMPVIAYYFNYIPVMGIFYNLLLLPIFTVILIYGFILLIFNGIFPALFIVPFKIFDYILYSLRFIIEFSEEVAFNGLVVPTMSMCHTIFFYTVLFFMIYLYNNKTCLCKKYGLTAIISIYAVTYIVFPFVDDALYFNVADAGQGLFTTLKYKNINMVIDCGSTSSKSMGEYTVIPYLTKKGISHVDGVFISHWDDDHYSGLKELLLSNIEVKNIFSSEENDNFSVQVLSEGKQMNISDLRMEILWPYENITLNNRNNSSLVISITFNNRNILLPGDIEKQAEYAIYNNLKHYDIIIVPHHGSNTSSTEQFIDAVSPKFALLSYGRNNYGIPDNEVILRYENANSKVMSTFEQGEINFIFKEDNLYYNTYTNEKSRNYYELYFDGMITKLLILCLLIIWILSDKRHALNIQI